jgi:hypothetical protein
VDEAAPSASTSLAKRHGHKENLPYASAVFVAPALLTRRGPPPTQRGK